MIMLEDKPTIAVAVSGGADSLALTMLLKKYLDTIHGKLIAITVNHNLRQESLSEAEHVQKMLTGFNIEHHILNYEGNIPKSNIMEQARNFRYDLICNFCKKNNIINLSIAQHFDDQVENFFIRLDRGSGIEGLSAIPMITSTSGIRILRPLLPFRKKDIYSFLTAKHIQWIEDPTNRNKKYKRNNIRGLLENINLADEISNNVLEQRIFKTSNHLLRANLTLNNLVNIFFAKHTSLNKNGSMYIDLENYKQLDSEISLRILSQSLQTISGNIKPARFEKLNNLYNLIKNNDKNLKKCTLHGCTIKLHKNKINIYRDHGLIKNKKLFFDIENNFSIYWDNRFLIKIQDAIKNTKDKNNNENNGYFITKLNEQDRLQLKKTGTDFIGYDIDFLYSLPIIKTVIKESNCEIIEKIIAVPHINYYINNVLQKEISVGFLPLKPLTKVVYDI